MNISKKGLGKGLSALLGEVNIKQEKNDLDQKEKKTFNNEMKFKSYLIEYKPNLCASGAYR